ncbi:MAG: hypothetical protein RIC35_20435 [Marinoscillum sp.]
MKKVLVISYYWPPSGGVSVLRSLKTVKYLRSFGWDPIVYVPSNAHYPYKDTSGFRDIPEGLKIIKRPILEPFSIFKWLTGRSKSEPLNSIVQVRSKKQGFLDKFSIWVRGNFFIPDARSLWVRPSVRYLSKYLLENDIDAIFTDGPPHTNTRIGCLLAKKFSIPWLADFQDPWTQVDYYKMLLIGNRAHKIHSQMEQEVFSQANKITIASPTWAKDLEEIGAENVNVIFYGYDEPDFNKLESHKSKEYFDIVHIGLLGIDRNPEIFLQVLEKIKTNVPVRIRLAGQVDYSILERLNSISNVTVDHLGTLKRSDALQMAMDANLLLLPLNQAHNAKGRLPAKLYEYLRTYNPILALGPTDSDAAKIITTCESGKCFSYEDYSSIESYILKLMDNKITFKPNTSKVSFYSNENQTRLLATYLDQIVN